MRFEIRNAIANTNWGASIDFLVSYLDYAPFEASSIKEAIEFVEGLQAEHDKDYREAGCAEYDFMNAPSYIRNLFVYDEAAEEFIKVEV